jgi:N-acetyl-anhydromuramyl-L-alanine amidase AmpD
MSVQLTDLTHRYKGNVRRRAHVSVTQIVVHHDAGRAPTDPAKVVPRLDAYDRQHDNVGGMPYHYVIDPWGKAYKCREIGEVTAHARGGNSHGLAIMLMGYFHRDSNFNGQKPTPEQLATLRALVAELRAAMPSIKLVLPHRDVPGSSTACPGSLFPYEIFPELNAA